MYHYSNDAKGSLGPYVSSCHPFTESVLPWNYFSAFPDSPPFVLVFSPSHLPYAEHPITSALPSTVKVVCSRLLLKVVSNRITAQQNTRTGLNYNHLLVRAQNIPGSIHCRRTSNQRQ